jgi:SAM-dependent methyltransferase
MSSSSEAASAVTTDTGSAASAESIKDQYLRIDKSGRFTIDDIALIAHTHKTVGNSPNTPWDHLRCKHLVLPGWFKTDLDPLSDEYLDQQKRLWGLVAGVDRDYVPDLDEAEVPLPDVDPVRQPGFYIWRNETAVVASSDHIIATGMLMKHSGLQPGMWALEYGAGFGQTALALARLGVNVDTVDISQTFCGYVQEQADFFRVNLTPFNAEFGHNPRGDQKYDLIWFYESFHHCLDFKKVVTTLKSYLTPNGKILMAGEPIHKRSYEAVPYPWGLRLEAEVVAMVRNYHWFELGYTEDFIVNFFTNNGYSADCFDCPPTLFGLTYSFTPRTSRLDLGKQWLPIVEANGWHAAEPTGRWTRAVASLSVDQTDTFSGLEVAMTNYHRKQQVVSIEYGGVMVAVPVAAGEHKIFCVDAAHKSPHITFRCKAIVPGIPLFRKDARPLGIFVHYINYV